MLTVPVAAHGAARMPVSRDGLGAADAAGARPSLRDPSRIFGYARVSSVSQNLDRQLDALAAFGVPAGNVFADKASGKDFDRPAWGCLLDALQEGDVLVATSVDRLGRSYAALLEQWRLLTKKLKVSIVILDMPLLDTRSSEKGDVTGELIADIVLQLLSYISHMERENIKARQAEGIRAARARGVHLGRPRKNRPEVYVLVKEAYLAGDVTRAEAAVRCGCGVTTFDRWLAEDAARR